MTFSSNNYKFANETVQVFFPQYIIQHTIFLYFVFYYQLVYTKQVAGFFLQIIKAGFEIFHEFCSWLTK